MVVEYCIVEAKPLELLFSASAEGRPAYTRLTDVELGAVSSLLFSELGSDAVAEE